MDSRARRVLLAPLSMTSLRWTSADIAGSVATSQAEVARTWRKAYSLVDDDLARTIRQRMYAIHAVGVGRSNSYIVLVPQTGIPPCASGPSFMRSPKRPALQTLLAADLTRDSDAPDFGEFPELPPSAMVLTRIRLDSVPNERQFVVQDALRWQQLLGDLVPACMSESARLHSRLLEWSQVRRSAFAWSEQEAPPAEPARRTSATPPPMAQAIAQEAFSVILQRIGTGQLAGGDRITETFLQRALPTSRNQARDALRNLALAGLVQLEPNRGAAVPVPRAADVIDTYAARRALGTLIIERACESPRRDLAGADAALADMLQIAEMGDARATGDADVRFQDQLTTATEMRHVPEMFKALSSQILLFTAVLGLKYVYSIPEMVRDDVRILTAVHRRERDAAVEAWHAKIDAAMTFMTAHL